VLVPGNVGGWDPIKSSLHFVVVDHFIYSVLIANLLVNIPRQPRNHIMGSFSCYVIIFHILSSIGGTGSSIQCVTFVFIPQAKRPAVLE